MTGGRRDVDARARVSGVALWVCCVACVGCRPAAETPVVEPEAEAEAEAMAASNRARGDRLEATIPTADGELLEISAWQGRVVVVALSASWDGAGEDGLAFFAGLRPTGTDEAPEVVVVAVDPSAPDLERWPEWVWPGWDPQGAVAARLRVRGFPTTFVVGRDGRLVEIVDTLDAEGRARITDAVATALADTSSGD
jgi:hypothetical protein